MNRRQEILRRAAEIFARQGVSQTSIEDIAKAVGIKREGVYYYFKSRTDILLKIILPESKTLLMTMRAIMRSRDNSTEKLRAALTSHIHRFNPAYLEMSVALREGHLFENESELVELRQVWQEYSDLWIELVNEGQAEGSFDPGLDAKAAAFAALGMCNWLSRWYDPEGEISIDRITQNYFSLLTRGLQA